MASLPLVGISLKPKFYQQILEEKPNIDWLEIHSENFFMEGGPTIEKLSNIRELYPISIHGIGLSLGSSDGICMDHLNRLKRLIDLIDPFLVSEHLSWNKNNKLYLPDLLPVPYTKESWQVFYDNINKAQDFLQREILIENPSSYLEYTLSTYSEQEFLVSLVKSTGAKILLDVNNIFVSSFNHQWDANKYIENIPFDLVKEIHIAGHSNKNFENGEILKIDTHDNFVCEEVWALFENASERFNYCPTLLEWDSNIPTLDVLIKEAAKIYNYCNKQELVRA